jgi:hypothetical protein
MMKNVKNSTVYVSKTVGPSRGAPPPEGEEDIIAVHEFATEPAKVTVEYGLTMNLGDYNSAKLTVSVTVPCYKEEIDDAYEFAQAWAEQRLEETRDVIDASRKGRANPL